jgi:pimeloyl-ACP methyl ester carboxylesterase
VNSREYSEIDKRVRDKRLADDGSAFSCAGAEIYALPFVSSNAGHLLGAAGYRCPVHGIDFQGEEIGVDLNDCSVEENIQFRYPLVREPAQGAALRRHDRVIILLHGLNERSYAKYLPWALRIQRDTGSPVILFPLAFHMSRGLPSWAATNSEIHLRRRDVADNECSHRFNATISDRLEKHPERFFWAGVQTYLDLTDLAREIRAGRHPHFAADARVDFLGYSAGGYISLMLLMENPEELFSASRAVIFGSAVPLRDLNLASPLILDTAAETALTRMYIRQIDRPPNARMEHWLQGHGEGTWFRALAGLKPNHALTEQRLRQIGSRIQAIANANDTVTPAGPMLNSLQGLRRDTGIDVAELNLGLHESPFVSDGYGKSCRRLITEVLDEERYGESFERFVQICGAHFGS